MAMNLLIFGGELLLWNMGTGKEGGALEFVGGLISVSYGEVLVKGGRAFLSISLLCKIWFSYFLLAW